MGKREQKTTRKNKNDGIRERSNSSGKNEAYNACVDAEQNVREETDEMGKFTENKARSTKCRC